MLNIKVRVKVDLKNPFMCEVLPIGFETEIVPKLSTKERVVPAWKTSRWNKETQKVETFVHYPEYIIPIGNFEGYSFVGADGFKYGDNFLGTKPLDEIFEKI